MAGLAGLATIAVGVVGFATLEFGARPEATLRPVVHASDVKFIEATGIRFAYLEEGQGPLVLLFVRQEVGVIQPVKVRPR